jgi:hypothetical protein
VEVFAENFLEVGFIYKAFPSAREGRFISEFDSITPYFPKHVMKSSMVNGLYRHFHQLLDKFSTKTFVRCEDKVVFWFMATDFRKYGFMVRQPGKFIFLAHFNGEFDVLVFLVMEVAKDMVYLFVLHLFSSNFGSTVVFRESQFQ